MRPGDAAPAPAAHRPQQLFCKRSLKAAAAFRQQLQQWRRLYAVAARTLSEFPNCRPPTHPPTHPAGCCRKKLLHKSFPFSSVCLGMRAMRCAPLMFLLECSKTTVLSEAPVPSVSGNVCGNHISRYECVLCTHSTSWVTTYNLLSATLHHILNNLQGPYDDKAIHARRCF